MPAISIVCCWTSGKARPMASASTNGSLIRAAQLIGWMPLPPPISAAITATTGRPVTSSRLSRSHSPSRSDPSFSIDTVGAPMPPQDMISPSSGRSSRSTRSTGPHSRIACVQASTLT